MQPVQWSRDWKALLFLPIFLKNFCEGLEWFSLVTRSSWSIILEALMTVIHGLKFYSLAETWQISIHGQGSYTEVIQMSIYQSNSVQSPFQIFAAQSVLPAIAGSADHCILMAGKSPYCQNTISQKGRLTESFFSFNLLVDGHSWLPKEIPRPLHWLCGQWQQIIHEGNCSGDWRNGKGVGCSFTF